MTSQEMAELSWVAGMRLGAQRRRNLGATRVANREEWAGALAKAFGGLGEIALVSGSRGRWVDLSEITDADLVVGVVLFDAQAEQCASVSESGLILS